MFIWNLFSLFESPVYLLSSFNPLFNFVSNILIAFIAQNELIHKVAIVILK